MTSDLSFVLLTDGRPSRQRCLDLQIEAILSQVDDPEIIVVGPHPNVPYGCVHVPAEAETQAALLSAKINLGCSAAERRIIVHMHDDMVLHEHFAHWFRFNEWDRRTDWDILAPNYVLLQQGEFRGLPMWPHNPPEYPIWTLGGPTGHHPIPDAINWDQYCYVSGEALVLTKDAWRRCPWQYDNDHRLTRGGPSAYDVVFGRAAWAAGLRTVFDPRVRMYHLSLRSFTENVG